MATADWLVPAAATAATFIGNERTNISNARQAMSQMAFQERMSSTAWQRGVQDMKAAGLNPALAYQKGGADSPGGAMATMRDSMSEAVSSGMQARMLRANLRQAEASAFKTEEEGKTVALLREDEQYRVQQQGRLAGLQGSRLYDMTPLEVRLLEDELTENRPLARQMIRKQMEATGASAREIEQRIELTDRMTPDDLSAWLQRNLLPFLAPLVSRGRF